MSDLHIKTATLRAELADIINRVCAQRSRAVIRRHGEPIAVLMSLEEVQELDRQKSLYTTIQKDHIPA